MLPWLQIYHDNRENRRASSHSPMDLHFMALINAGFILNMLEKCNHFTLTESLVIEKKLICWWQVQSLRKRDESGRGRHLEQKIWFLTINQVQPTLFLYKLLSKLRSCHTTAYGPNVTFLPVRSHTLTYVRVSYLYIVYVKRTSAYAGIRRCAQKVLCMFKICQRMKFTSVIYS